MDDVPGEFSGSLPARVEDQLVGAERMTRRIGDDLQLTVAVDVPGAGGFDVADPGGDDMLGPFLGGIA